MMAAARSLSYERAAELRNKREVLVWLNGHLQRLSDARQRHSFVYPVAGRDGTQIWYVVRQGRVEAVMSTPADAAGRRHAIDLLESIYYTDQARPAWPPSEIDAVFLIAAWFRRYPEELARTLSAAEALALCRAVRL
jgi:excinuclease ABC subunit C